MKSTISLYNLCATIRCCVFLVHVRGSEVHERAGGRTCAKAGHVLGEGTAQKLMFPASEYIWPQLSSLYSVHSPV